MANYLNTAFAITFVGDSLKIVFAAPLNETIYINSNLFYIQLCSINSTAVDLGEYDAGITTVNYQLATAPNPAALTRVQWIAAVLALITVPNNAPTTLATSALTDSVVGYNNTTKQFTDLGNAPQHRFYVYSTIAQFVAAGGTTVLYNTIIADPMSGYNPATGIYTIPYAGNWSFGADHATTVLTVFAICLNGTSVVNDAICWGTCAAGGVVAAASVCYYCNVGDTVRVISYVQNSNLNISGKLNNFWGKRIV